MIIENIFRDLLGLFAHNYNAFLESSFSEFWESGEYSNQKIKWKNSKKAKDEIKAFKERGIYIWGYDKTPLYIGKTVKQQLTNRFNRYISGKKSQCKLAQKYERALKIGAKNKTVEALKKEFKISRSKALGVKKFGEIGMNRIWFIIIPIKDVSIISSMESTLISVGEKWNKDKGFEQLINFDK